MSEPENDPLPQLRANIDQFGALAAEFAGAFHSHYKKLQAVGFDQEMASELTLVFADNMWETAMRPPK